MSQGKFLLVGIVAVLVYGNTLLADFTFDDQFAVITNADVTSDAVPLSDLFKHDFWGQNISSSQSHKSYRPITILVFRLTRQIWGWATDLAPWLPAALPTAPPLRSALSSSDSAANARQAAGLDAEEDGRAARPPGLHPFPFHLVNVVLHAVVSMLVLALALHMFAVLERVGGPQQQHQQHQQHQQQVKQEKHEQQENGVATAAQPWLMRSKPLLLWAIPSSSCAQMQALLAALLFALHPVHTEAVAGVVGCAELICATLSIPALLLYCMAVDERYAAAGKQQQQQQQQQHGGWNVQDGQRNGAKAALPARVKSSAAEQTDHGKKQQQQQQQGQVQHCCQPLDSNPMAARAHALRHWGLVGAALLLTLLAALSKEIGITIAGTMAVYDLLLAPHMTAPDSLTDAEPTGRDGQLVGAHAPPCPQQQQFDQQRSAVCSAAPTDARRLRCQRQLMRLLLLAGVTLLYVTLRSHIAVQQLVSIYRKVENPIPFAASRATRLLSTSHLHTRYAGLLLLPAVLSADWSYPCVPLVEGVSDPRNLASIVLYAALVAAVLAARPAALARQAAAAAAAALLPPPPPRPAMQAAAAAAAAAADMSRDCWSAVSTARWVLMLLVGLILAPFFPASNVLFYVGTYIGERLLYLPSVGACLLAAHCLRGLLMPLLSGSGDGSCSRQQARGATGTGTSTSTSTTSATISSCAARAWACVRLCLLVCLLLAAAGRTLHRNVDWWDDERLFMSALGVCPNSAKVQLNVGMLARRRLDFDAALTHFRRAQALEPGYCEPAYWIALTAINSGDVLPGLAAMRESLSCKYTAAEALGALNRLYVMLHEGSPLDPRPMMEWARVLGSAHVQHTAEACATAEDAALLFAVQQTGKSSRDVIDAALAACEDALSVWEQGECEPDTLAGLARSKHADLNATLIRGCLQRRRPLYHALGSDGPASSAARIAAYSYMSQLESGWQHCRSVQGGGNAESGVAGRPPLSSHQKLVHRVQTAVPENPWLQQEWGMTLLAVGAGSPEALHDAGRHLQAAAAMFTHDVGSTKARRARKGQPGYITALDGKTELDDHAKLAAAVVPLQRLLGELDAAAAAGARGDREHQEDTEAATARRCGVLQHLCHLRLQVLALPPPTAAAHQIDDEDALLAQQEQANTAGRDCMLQLLSRRGCEQHAAQLRQLVSGGR